MNTEAQPNPGSATTHTFGVVIVTYNSQSVVSHCIAPLLQWNCVIVVVDNASSDETVQIARSFPVQVIANQANLGFAAAVNQGFSALDTEWILLLNPDVTVTSPLDPLTSASHSDDTGAVTALLTSPDGEPQYQFQFRRFPSLATLVLESLGINRTFPGNPWNQQYRYLGYSWEQGCDVEQPAGAFLLVRRKAWEQLGGFDELFYPLWFEDVDFCFRLRKEGWRIRYLPIRMGHHSGAHSIQNLEPGVRQLYWYRSLLRYAEKYFSVFSVRILASSIILALGGKALMMALQFGHPGTPAAVWPALKMAVGILFHRRHPSSGTADC
ncbi:MAG: glycosyltransferase family 2 protein [Bryobacterales bacterium]|nr:glycosyltransferase family 2 protein [Bryobacterales bacterium]